MALDTEPEIREVDCFSTQHCIDHFLEPLNNSVGEHSEIAGLVQQAANFAKTGYRRLDLGRAYWELMHDRDAALEV